MRLARQHLGKERDLRVLQLADLYPPSVGGTQRHTQQLARELARRGHRSAVATLSRSLEVECEDTGQEVLYRVPMGPVNRAFGQGAEFVSHPPFPLRTVINALAEVVATEQPDVVYGHNWMIYSYLPLRKRGGPPVSYVLHDYCLVCPIRSLARADGAECSHDGLRDLTTCSADARGALRGGVVGAGFWHAQRKWHGYIDKYVAVSRYVADASLSQARGHEIEVIPTFVANNLSELAEQTPRPEFLPDCDYLLFVGAMARIKGIDILLKAYERLAEPRPPLVVIGTVQPDMPDSWPTGVLVFTDIPHPQVMSAWKHSLFGVIPSVWPEAMGQVAVEAMAAGKAVVASRAGGLADVVRDGETGLQVTPGDPEELAVAITKLLTDPELAERLGMAAKAQAPEYTVSRVADRVEIMLKETSLL